MSLKSIALIRHAESLEDVDPTLHNVSDDSIVSLTEHGRSKARNIGEHLSRKISHEERVRVYLSTSHRARETWEIISEFIVPVMIPTVDGRIRNLNWGNITLETRSQIEAERYRAGVLYYQFPGGDNTPDYISAIGRFVSEVFLGKKDEDYPEHVVIVTHGFALRVIAKFLLAISDEEFRELRNPPNGYVLRVEHKNHSFIPETPLLRVAK